MMAGREAGIVVDVWGGDRSQDHVARLFRPWSTSLMTMVKAELDKGFLVNLRAEASWGRTGPDGEFDNRRKDS